MSRLDQLVDRGADHLHGLAERMAAEGGSKAKLADTLADDAEFLRKLKPSLIKARARGEMPTNEKPGTVRLAPAGPQLGTRRKRRGEGGPNPFLVVGVALVTGILLAKVIDWRGHRYPRD